MKRHLVHRSTARSLWLSLALVAGLALPLPALAASVALATAPLATSTTSTVKPNVMFILDDSGSMDWDYLPDWANDNFPGTSTSYSSVPALHRNNGFNGVAYNAAITYTPPVLYNADGTLNTTTYPNIASPWTSVQNDAFGIQSTSSTNLVTSFPDVEWCTDSFYTNCLRNDNLILPGTVGGVAYTTKHSKVATGAGYVATGAPDAPTTAARSFGPFYYTIVPGEYCDSADFKNCQTTQTTTFKFPAKLRWCNSSALTTCQSINTSTYKYPRYPTKFYVPAIAYSPAMPAVPAVAAVTGVAASASFTFNFSGSLNPTGFSIKVNGTEILSATTPGALLNSSGMATWVQSHSSLAGYTISNSGSTVTLTATTTGTAKNISSIVITETAPATVTYTTNPTLVGGVTPAAATAPTNGTLNISDVDSNRTVSLKCGATFIGQTGTWTSTTSSTKSTRLDGLYTKIATTTNGYTISCAKNGSPTASLSCSVAAPAGVSACSSGFTVDSNIITTTNTGPSGGTNAVAGVKAAGTITFTNATSLNPTGVSIQVNGAQIMSATTPGALTSSSGMATWVKNNSSLANYVITSSGSTVTFTASANGPAWNISSITYTQTPPTTTTTPAPTYVYSPGVDAVAATPYIPATPEVLAVPGGYFGSFIRTDIVPGTTSYPYPGTATKAATRTDCAGTTCTYTEEMTNFANWWTYYHTRMQAMKTSVSRSFKSLTNTYRVGFTTISDTGATDGTKFLGNNTFELAHKNSWFTKLFATGTPGYTPLRGALSKAGRYYGKKITGQVDPVQYSCQQNFTILSTDGYWNTDDETSSYGPFGLTGSNVGNLDGGTTARPMYEGPTASSNTLADVAKYYYDTDLRTSALGNCAGGISTDFPSGNPDVCTNNVFIGSTDNNVKQHMTTFTMGLGADGTLNYTSDYQTATSGDYYNLKNGLSSTNWPVPAANSATAIDDLWHAAVNGQGIYFSAKDPDQIITGFNNALSSITAKLGSAAAAATSTLNPVAGNNFAYVASYTTVKWTGNLEARTINTSTGVVSETATWCAENVASATCASPGTVVADTSGSSTIYNCVVTGSTAATCTSPGVFDSGTSTCKTEITNACTGTLPAKVGATTDTRNIYAAPAGGLTALAGQNLVPFDAAYATANPANFAAAHINALNQWGSLDATQRTAAAGVNLINYLRGQNGFEDRAANVAANRLYRARETVLGDALESQPAFISKPVFSYPYPGYGAYKTAQASRAGTVFMGTNDGMMHAFATSDGTERWAYVPSMVIPNMWKLASTSYSTNHANFVNGSPVTTDVCTALCTDPDHAVWKTILVGGLNGGGRGYYALDITVPDTPILLWEFTDIDLGYSYGLPIVTRKADGTWVVLVTSGYNNTGIGYLYVLNAATGAIISKISTGVGIADTPSGLAKIAGWNDEIASNGNKAGYVYGGDLLGNVWRFDINSAVAAITGTGAVMKFATLFSDTAGTLPQPITTTPVLGTIAGKRVIFIGTGKYLETGDLTNTQQQTQYAIQDDNATTTLVNPRTTLVQQTLSMNADGTATRTSSNTASCTFSGRGWYVDFPDIQTGQGSERVNIDSKLLQGTLLVPTIVPSNTVCSPGGYGWLNFLNYETGCAVDPTTNTTNLASLKYDSTIVGVNVIYIGGSPLVEVVTSTNPTPEIPKSKIPFVGTTSGFTGKRVIWRELIP